MSEEPDARDEGVPAAQSPHTEAIDPVIAEDPSAPALDPVVRSAATEETESTGFMKSLTSTIASTWNASREAQEQDEEWDERPGVPETGVRGAAGRGAGARGTGFDEDSEDPARHEFDPAAGAIDPRELGGYDPQTSSYTFHDQPREYPGHPREDPGQARASSDRPCPGLGETPGPVTEWYHPDGTRVVSPAAGAIPIIDPHTGRPVAPSPEAPTPQTPAHTGQTPSAPAPGVPTPGTPTRGIPSSGVPGPGVSAPGTPITGVPLDAGTAPAAGPASPLTPRTWPIRRRSVLRSSRRRRSGTRGSRPLFDRSVFDHSVRPQSVLRRLMRPEAPMTSAVPIVDHLAGTPFENPRQAEAPVDTDELETIAFVLDIGEALFRYGAGALEVETSIIAITAAFGMKNTDVDITNQSISLNWAPDGKTPYSRVRVVRSWSSNFQALAGVHHLVTDIISGRLTRAEAVERLEEITHEPKPFPRWMVTLAGAVFASAFASFLGAPLLDATVGFFATLVVLGTTRRLVTLRVPEFYTLSAGGFVATFIAMGAVALEIPVEPFHVVAGGLMIMLPSVRVVSAIQDAINGFPLTSAGRIVSSMIAFIGLTSGIMVAVITANLLGTPEIEPARALERLYPFPVLVALVFLAAVAAAIVEQARWRILVPIGAVSALGFCGYYAAELVGLGERITPVIGGIVVGALGRMVALRMNAPQLVVAVPAMMFMLPGLMVFRGMYSVAMRTETDVLAGLPVGMRESAEVLSQVPIGMLTGLTDLFNAMIIILGIAGGIVLGDVMMRPFTSAMQSHERRRFRHR